MSLRRCPHCGARDTKRIVYGLPGPELGEAAMRGEVELGGCVIRPGQPTRRCGRCGASWRYGVGGRAVDVRPHEA